MDGCPDCRAELAAIAPLAGPLSRIDPEGDRPMVCNLNSAVLRDAAE